MNFIYELNGQALEVAVEGETLYGADVVMLDEDDDLTAGAPWHDDGFVVTPSLTDQDTARLRDGIRKRIIGICRAAGAELPDGARLEDYHRSVTDEQHARVVEAIRAGFPLDELPIEHELLERRISELTGVPVIARNFDYGLNVFNLRIVRPGKNDNNPLHRDVWLDRLRNGINIYAPLAGSNERSSLAIVPRSHVWKESDILRTARGARVNGLPYTVPAVVGARRELRLVRPNPSPSELLVFSPYLIHGGAVNLGEETRVSLEMRFWRAPVN